MIVLLLIQPSTRVAGHFDVSYTNADGSGGAMRDVTDQVAHFLWSRVETKYPNALIEVVTESAATAAAI